MARSSPIGQTREPTTIMISKVIEVMPAERYKRGLRFHDGVSGTADLSAELWGPMFEPLRNTALFAQATIHPELKTVTWPNGADLAPEFLYHAARHRLSHVIEK